MANEKISQLPAITNSAVGANSLVPLTDSTDTTTKSIQLSQLDLRWAPFSTAAVATGAASTASAAQTTANAAISQTTGDVVTPAGGGSKAATIQPNVVTNAKAAQMAGNTIKGNNTGSTANALDLSVSQVKGLLNVVPLRTILTATGTTTGYVFTCSSANATVGATYTNNGQTFTVQGTITTDVLLFCTATGAPAASGTLTKATGTGDASITFSANIASGTYTPQTGCLYMAVRIVGAGGGGGGSGTTQNAGVAGKPSYFGPNMLIAGGGGGGNALVPGTGGTASIGTGASGQPIQGQFGGAGQQTSVAGVYGYASNGGSSPFGAGGAYRINAAGNAGTGNGSGGSGGGGITTASTEAPGGGAGAGGFINAIVPNVSASYPIVVGLHGTAGSAGTSGFIGGIGTDGLIEITEFYQ